MSATSINPLAPKRPAARGRIAAWVTAFVGLAMAGVALAQASNSIESITVSKGTSGRTIVKFQLKAPPTNPPAGFAIASPPRIALDFLDTTNGIGATQQAVEDPALRSFNLVQAGSRTRVVFNLNTPQTFRNQRRRQCGTGHAVRSERLGDRPGRRRWSGLPRRGPTIPSTASRDVDFRRGRNGEGRIVVDLSDNSTGIDIRQQGNRPDRRLHQDDGAAQSRSGVSTCSDFGTPVQTVDTFAQGRNARMVIEPKGFWEHSAYQTDNQFIIEVKPIQEDPNKLTQGTRAGYKGEKLSLNFQNVEVRAVLQVIADFTGLNIITSDTVGGNLTLRLKDVPWDQALDIILQTKGLDMRKNGNVVLIAPREELAAEGKAAARSRSSRSANWSRCRRNRSS